MQADATSPLIDEHVFLTGRPPMGEFLGFVKAQTVGGQTQDLSALADRWREANDHIQELESREAGLADSPPLKPLLPEQEAFREKVLGDPIFQRSYQICPPKSRPSN